MVHSFDLQPRADRESELFAHSRRFPLRRIDSYSQMSPWLVDFPFFNSSADKRTGIRTTFSDQCFGD